MTIEDRQETGRRGSAEKKNKARFGQPDWAATAPPALRRVNRQTIVALAVCKKILEFSNNRSPTYKATSSLVSLDTYFDLLITD